MNTFRSLHTGFLTLFAVVFVAILALVHFSINKIVAEQSVAHQRSLSPAIDLITQQIIKPLHISEALGKSTELVELINTDSPDETRIIETLKRLEREFNLRFFLAAENNRKQYFSNGETLELDPQKVNWYFKYKALPLDSVVDIGKWEDPHFYIDIKIYAEDGRFLGFFGIGKSLTSFVDVFSRYKDQYGYDFIFVDRDGDIMLSSDSSLLADYSSFINIKTLPWYKALPDTIQQSGELNNTLVSINGNDAIIAEVSLNQFGWTMYLLTPLNERQTEISRPFIVAVVVLVIVITALFLFVYSLLYHYRKKIDHGIVSPTAAPLIPQQSELEIIYNSLPSRNRPISALVIRIANLDAIRHDYNLATQENVIHRVSCYLTTHKREFDILGELSDLDYEMGSGLFMLLLPNTNLNEARTIAHNLRYGIATMVSPIHQADLTITPHCACVQVEPQETFAQLCSRAQTELKAM